MPTATITLPPLLLAWLQFYCSAHGDDNVEGAAIDMIAQVLDEEAGEFLQSEATS